MPENNHHIILYRSDTAGNAQNCVYRHEVRAANAEELCPALRYDHIFVKFRDNRRSNQNFEYADYLVLDCDNDHSENRDDWIQPEELAQLLPEVPFVLYSSRHHNMAKENKAPRPRFHVIFPIERIRDAEKYAALKRKAAESLPFFDHNALDAGRFFFAVENAEILFHRGDLLLTDWLATQEESDNAVNQKQYIPEGKRNSTLFRCATSILKRHGDTDTAKASFLQKAALCTPPLPENELSSIWENARKFYRKTICLQPGYVPPENYPSVSAPVWEEPVPLEGPPLPLFPAEVLPPILADYVAAVAESLQIPPDMAAVCALGALSVCCQKKFAVRINDDWLEPINLYLLVVAEPSEKKSPCIKQMIYPIQDYERKWNRENSLEIATTQKVKSALKRRVEALEKKVAAGNASEDDLREAVDRELTYIPLNALRLFLDDVTPEKLTSQLAENGGTCAIMSAEGGIFDTFSGKYSGSANFDVALKAYSADSIRVDRSTRESETIDNPSLTMLLMSQPSVLSDVMGNREFRGRGLTARFLYCIPASRIGTRIADAETVPPVTRTLYENMLLLLLKLDCKQTTEITLSPEAEMLRRVYTTEIDRRLLDEYADFKDWAGKIAGTTMRIAALLCLADAAAFLLNHPGQALSFSRLCISEEQMQRALILGSYFIDHAKAAYCRMGSVQLIEFCKRALSAIRKNHLKELSTRKLMKACTFLATAEEAQKVLDHLEVLGYLSIRDAEARHGRGRPSNPVYLVTPYLYQEKK